MTAVKPTDPVETREKKVSDSPNAKVVVPWWFPMYHRHVPFPGSTPTTTPVFPHARTLEFVHCDRGIVHAQQLVADIHAACPNIRALLLRQSYNQQTVTEFYEFIRDMFTNVHLRMIVYHEDGGWAGDVDALELMKYIPERCAVVISSDDATMEYYEYGYGDFHLHPEFPMFDPRCIFREGSKHVAIVPYEEEWINETYLQGADGWSPGFENVFKTISSPYDQKSGSPRFKN